MKKGTAIIIAIFVIFLLLSASGQTENKPEKPVLGKEYHPSGTKGGPMMFVPAGEFQMGEGSSMKKVNLEDYYIDEFEVTQEEYNECVSSGACSANQKSDGFTGDRQPVVGVSWLEAQTYCKWAGKKLPTEAEWEKAARGTDGLEYPWGNQKPSCNLAIMNEGPVLGESSPGCGRQATTWPVASKPAGASPFGAMDMAGNAWEWVDSSQGKNRVVRGGSWRTTQNYLRTSYRLFLTPDYRGSDLGFRCARTP